MNRRDERNEWDGEGFQQVRATGSEPSVRDLRVGRRAEPTKALELVVENLHDVFTLSSKYS